MVPSPIGLTSAVLEALMPIFFSGGPLWGVGGWGGEGGGEGSIHVHIATYSYATMLCVARATMGLFEVCDC